MHGEKRSASFAIYLYPLSYSTHTHPPSPKAVVRSSGGANREAEPWNKAASLSHSSRKAGQSIKWRGGPRSENRYLLFFFSLMFCEVDTKLANTLTLQQTAVWKQQRSTYNCTALASHNSRTTCVSKHTSCQDENIDNTAPSEPCDILFWNSLCTLCRWRTCTGSAASLKSRETSFISKVRLPQRAKNVGGRLYGDEQRPTADEDLNVSNSKKCWSISSFAMEERLMAEVCTAAWLVALCLQWRRKKKTSIKGVRCMNSKGNHTILQKDVLKRHIFLK